MRTIDTTPLTTPGTSDNITIDERAADVLTSMLFGEHGDRVRSYARAEVGKAWTGQRLADAPGVLTAVLDQLRAHLHPIHVNEILKRVVVQLLIPDHEPPDSRELDDDDRG